jgi:DNA-binding MurR/RpiR family transcriptional regulator
MSTAGPEPDDMTPTPTITATPPTRHRVQAGGPPGDAEGGDVAERIAAERQRLSPAERRVAEVVLRDPAAVAFGTVAGLAASAGTSGASVVRLASRLGYRGFSELQAAVQGTIGQQLAPAVQRIRTEPGSDVVSRTLRAELGNVERTLRTIEPHDFDRAVTLLADRTRAVRVVAGDAESGVGTMLATALALLRDDVAEVTGSDVAVARQLAHAGSATVVVALDLRRYERWVLDHVGRAAEAGADVVALTDSVLSPLASVATVAFTVSAEGAGPFDSHVGTLSLANALATGVAGRLRRTATRRLDAVEAGWRAAGALVDPD